MTTFPANDPGILYSPGNWDLTASRARTICSGAGLRTMATGNPTGLAATFATSGMGSPVSQVAYRVDNGPWTLADVAASVPLAIPADTATWERHTIELVVKATSEALYPRWTGDLTAVRFTGIETTGGTAVDLIAPPTRPLVGLVFGDSITEGVRTLRQEAPSGKDVDRNDALRGWAWLLGDLMGAEVGVVGFGGGGMTVPGSGAVPPFGESAFLLAGGGPARDFDAIDPDFVLVNAGANDAGDITAPLVSFASDLLAATPAKTQIVFASDYRQIHTAQTAAAVAAVASPRVHFVNTTGWWTAAEVGDDDDLHPEGYANISSIGPRMANAILPLVSGGGGARTYLRIDGQAVPVSRSVRVS